eukprot:GAHX01001186.1.p1 GENE.GAHX01001186.1~~GAHX01001186.1.p1  ORF type:complete len:334 (+),score=57.18 GAHX01001186.1:46-1047(+)
MYSILFIYSTFVLSHINSTSSPLPSSTQTSRFIDFKMDLFANNLLQQLDISQPLSQEISNHQLLEDCEKKIEYLSNFNIDQFTEIDSADVPGLITTLKKYSIFINNFYSLKNNCFPSLLSSLSQTDTYKSVVKIITNKIIFNKFFYVDKYFQSTLHKFTYLTDRSLSYLSSNSLSLECYEEYINSVHRVISEGLIELNSIQSSQEILLEANKKLKNVLEMIQGTFEVISFKHAINVFILIFEEIEVREGKGSKAKLVIKEEFLSRGAYGIYNAQNEQLNEVMGLVEIKLANLASFRRIMSLTEEELNEREYLRKSMEIISSFTRRVFSVVFKI